MSEEELKSILEKKREELEEKKRLEEQEEIEKAEIERQKKQILRSLLSRKARERLARIKLAKPELGNFVEQQLILLAQRGGISERMSDEQFKDLLKRINQQLRKKGETEIKFKRKGSIT